MAEKINAELIFFKRELDTIIADLFDKNDILNRTQCRKL